MKFASTIRSKLILGYTAVLMISVIGLSLIFYWQVKTNLTQQNQEILKEEFQATLTSLKRQEWEQTALVNFLSKRTVGGTSGGHVYFALYNREGLVAARSQNFGEYLDPLNKLRGVEESFLDEREEAQTGGSMYLLTQQFKTPMGNLWFLQFGSDYSTITETLETLRGTLLIIIPVILLLSLVGGIFLTSRTLHPISRLTDSAREITLSDLDKGLPLSGTGDELDQLRIAFNDLFKRLHNSYQKIIQFSADVSHELRLPITAIKGEAEIILSRERTLEEYQRVLGSTIEEMDRLTTMVNRLLTLIRADSGKDVLQKEDIDLTGFLKNLIDFYHPLAEEKQLTFSLETEEAIHVLADPLQLGELFSNLFENAIKYTNQGSVEVRLERSRSGIQVDVKDTGIGIPADELEKIFERFYRVDKSRARDEGGVGLGLSIAQSIAEAHGGNVSVKSQIGKGSTFSVWLPVHHG